MWSTAAAYLKNYECLAPMYLEMSSKINIQPITKNAGPTSPEEDWDERLGEELDALIDYQEQAKLDDRQWLQLEPVDEKGEKWEGKCWYFMRQLR